MLPWGESATLSEELTRESAHGGVPRLLLAVQVDNHGDGGADGDEDDDDDAGHKGVPGGLLAVHVAMDYGGDANGVINDDGSNDDNSHTQGIVRSVNQLVRAVPQSNHAQTQANQAFTFPILGANCPTIPG